MKNLNSSMIIKSNINNIKDVMNWIKADLQPLFELQNKFENLKLCLQEALTNAIVHGNKKDKSKSVDISYEVNAEIKITIKDEGKGIQKKQQQNSVSQITQEDILKESGRGIMLMKHFCDEIIFNKNSITLIVRYKK